MTQKPLGGIECQVEPTDSLRLAGLAISSPIEIMKFTLTYEGPLMASGNDPVGKPSPKIPHIWAIRHHFAPQLESIYHTHPALMGMGGSQGRAAYNETRAPILRGGFKFAAIVRPAMGLICELGIKMLVNHVPGSLVTRTGDLDNRLKTLFDALRVPADNEFRGHTPTSSGELFPCLLEDDALITKLSISTERWLNAGKRVENEVHLFIDVRVFALFPTFSNGVFAGD